MYIARQGVVNETRDNIPCVAGWMSFPFRISIPVASLALSDSRSLGIRNIKILKIIPCVQGSLNGTTSLLRSVY